MISSDKTNWPLVLLIWAAGLGAAAQYGKISVIFDRLPQIYPDAGTSLGFAVSLVGFLGILLGIVAGVLVARVGYRRALLTALVVGAGASAFQALFPPLPLFLSSRVVEGAAHLAIVVAAPTMIAQIVTQRESGLALTLWGTFFGVAFAVLAWAGLALVNAAGLASLLWAHAAYMALIALVLWPRLPRIVQQARGVRWVELITAHRRIYGSAYIGAPALGWLFYTLCFVSVLTLLPGHLDPSERAFVIGAMPLLSILSSLTFGVWLLRFMPATGVVILGFTGCAGCALLLWLLPGNAVPALALGASLGLVQGASFAAVAQLNAAPEDRALANGGLAQMGNLGNTAGTPLFLALIGVAGYAGFAIGMACVFLVGALIHLWLARQRG